MSNSCMPDNTTCRPKVSVIVPIYRGKSFFQSMLKCLQQQTLKDIELVFIDDCGEDGAFKLAEEAAKTDSRIVLIRNKQNSGPGISRNKGIEAAKGEYIAFVDSDDLIPLDYYNLLYSKALETGAWVVKGSCAMRHPDKTIIYSHLNEKIRDFLRKGQGLLNSYTYEHITGIYKRDFVNQIGARNGECYQGEDSIFLMKIMCHLPIDKIAFRDEALYYYRVNPASLTNELSSEYFNQSLESLKLRLNYLSQVPSSREVLQYIAEQFEDKIIARVRVTFHEPFICRQDRLSYLNAVLELLKEKVEQEPAIPCRYFSKMAISFDYDSEKLLEQLVIYIEKISKNNNKTTVQFSSKTTTRNDLYLILCSSQIRRKYYRIKFLSYITLGERRQRYKRKLEVLKARKKEIQNLIREAEQYYNINK